MATVTAGYTWTSGETVTPAKLNSAAAPTVAVTDGEVTAAKLASNAVETAKILDANVTQAKLASGVATTGPAFRAYASAATTGLSNGVAKKIELASEDFDTASCFASSRFTPNVAGYYFISAGIRWEALANCSALIVKNGTLHSIGSTPNAGTYHSVVTDLVYLNGSTDYVELHGIQYTGNNQSTGVATSGAYTWMSGFLARAA